MSSVVPKHACWQSAKGRGARRAVPVMMRRRSSTRCSAEVGDQRQRAVVIGAGPVGISSAAMLAKRGWQVEVFDKRAAPGGTQDSTSRTYPMQINRKARAALEEAAGLNLEEYFEPRTNTMGGHLVDWSGLTTELMRAALEQHPASLSFHWGSGLASSESIDLARKRVSVSTGEGERELEYDLLVGADGFNSAVRNKLLGAGFLESQVVYSASGPENSRYKVVHGLQKQEYAKLAAQPSRATAKGERISMTRQKFGFVRFAFWPRTDGTMSAMVMASKESDFEPETFASKLQQDAASLPQAWRDTIVKQCNQADASKFGAIVKNSSFAGPGVVLVGDAAHSVTSTLGQGCCLGLSGMKSLATAVDTADVDNIPLVYSRTWVRDAHALQQMEYQTVLSIRSGVVGAFWKLMSMLSVIGGTLLQYVVPKLVPKPLFFFWLAEPALTYRQVLTTYWGAVALGSGVLVGVAWILNAIVLNVRAAATAALFGA